MEGRFNPHQHKMPQMQDFDARRNAILLMASLQDLPSDQYQNCVTAGRELKSYINNI